MSLPANNELPPEVRSLREGIVALKTLLEEKAGTSDIDMALLRLNKQIRDVPQAVIGLTAAEIGTYTAAAAVINPQPEGKTKKGSSKRQGKPTTDWGDDFDDIQI